MYTKPWSAKLSLFSAPGSIFEYACHEGNYGMMEILSGARAQEKTAEEAAR